MVRPIHRVIGAASIVLSVVACSADRDPVVAPAPAGTVGVGRSVPAIEPTTAVPVTVESVAMVGDSITVGSMDELELGFSSLGLDDVEIDAESGRRMVLDGTMPSGLSAVTVIAGDDPPDLWVIALGTNDVANYVPDEYGPAIAELLAAVPTDAPLVWVDTYLDEFPEQSATFNDSLRDALEERGQATVVDWAGIAAEEGVLRDGVHPSGYGVDQFAGSVVSAVGDWMT